MNSLIYIIIFSAFLLLVLYFLKNKEENKRKTSNKKESSQVKSASPTVKNSNLTEKDNKELLEATQLVLQNNLGEELVFDRPNELSERKYHEVVLSKGGKAAGHLVQAATPVLERANTIAEIKKKAPYGLFTSTIDPDKLSKFTKDGSFSTMVHGPKGIKENKGFLKKNVNELMGKESLLSSANVAMQGAAALSGQYYLEEITNQLEDIDSKLDELIEFHHDERLAILKNAKNRLEEIIKRKNVELHDVDEIRQLRNSVREVFEEYQTRLNRELEEITRFKSNSLFVEKRLEDYVKEIDKIKFNIQVSYEADMLSIQAELAEIAVRMKLDNNDPMLKDLYLQLENNVKNSFSINIDKNIFEIFRPIDMHADNIVKKGKDLLIIKKDRKILLKSIYDISNNLEKTLDSRKLGNLLNNSLEQRNTDREILIVPDSETGEQKVYIPVVDK